MPKFILSFRSAKTYNALTDPGALPAWVKYLNEVVAPNVADPGWPVFEPATVIGEAGPSTQLGGYLIVTADELEAAVSIVKSCPNIEHGGGVEVGLLADLPRSTPPSGCAPTWPAQSPHNHHGEPIGGIGQRRPVQPTRAARHVYITNSTNEHRRHA